MAKLEELSLDELVVLQQDFNHQRAALKEKALAVQHVIDRKTAEQEVARKLATMSDDEKRALVHAITAQGIKSEEAVGKPGA